MKSLLVIVTVSVIGLTGTAEAQKKCPAPENVKDFQYSKHFQYSDDYSSKCLVKLLNSLQVVPEAPCSGKQKDEEDCVSNRKCTVYCRTMYSKNNPRKWSLNVEKEIQKGAGNANEDGKICPYSMTRYTSRKVPPEKRASVHVDHIVALAEAHDSGLCAPAREGDRKGFSEDHWNHIMANGKINSSKDSQDFTEWNLDMKNNGIKPDNKCWFASRVVQVRTKWYLTIDDEEKKRLAEVLKTCANFSLKLPSKTNAGADECNKVVP